MQGFINQLMYIKFIYCISSPSYACKLVLIIIFLNFESDQYMNVPFRKCNIRSLISSPLSMSANSFELQSSLSKSFVLFYVISLEFMFCIKSTCWPQRNRGLHLSWHTHEYLVIDNLKWQKCNIIYSIK